MGDAGKTLNDPAEYEEDEKSKRKKDKKDSKKDKGYAALAGESSHDEEELDPKSPGKAKKIKASFKLSAKKKDKKSVDKPDKERKNSDKEKDKTKKLDKEKKSIDKDMSSKEDGKSDKKSLDKEKIHGEKEKDKHKDKEKKSSEKEKEKKKEEKKKKLSIGGDKETHLKSSVGTSSPSHTEKEKGTLNLNQALNAFLNAPAPLLMKSKDKEHKKEKEGSSTSSKVKLKLKRSKNSLEDSQSSQSDLPFTVTHQFPEDPDAIAKEIRKYEALLEQTHSHMKSSKKISKKSEEQLWELQRTLTQLKRKLRSINALSVGSPASIPTCPQPVVSAVATTSKPDPVPPIPANINNNSTVKPEEVLKKPEEILPVAAVIAKPVEKFEEMKLDFTLKTVIPPPPSEANIVQVPKSVDNEASVNGSAAPVTVTPKAEVTGTMSPLKQEFDLNTSYETNNKISPNVISEQGSSNSNLTSSLTPEAEVERLQVEVQIHAQNLSPVTFEESDEEKDNIDTPDFSNNDYTLSASVIKTLTFSEDEDDDVIEEITDVSSLSLRNTNIENENSFLDENVDMTRSKISQATISGDIDPFEMPIFESEEYLAIENEALIFFNEELQEEIAREETEIEELMKQLEQMSHNGVDIDAPEIDLDLDQFEFEELVSLWQITKLENEALNEQVHHLRQMVAISKLEEFRLETRLKYLEEKTLSGRNCPAIPPLQECSQGMYFTCEKEIHRRMCRNVPTKCHREQFYFYYPIMAMLNCDL
ncbi:unnamed protein product [Allacma fusca]|uniref:RalA-binding protein 1-like Ral binding domain-containing protein n=1 Tax=Allacma fusca TaxID=39272 RepID=A0A8J2PFH6_9HEXA|nr:unnamed protein product [Allacma fusca]